jgi:hypothetical protein
MLHHAKPGESSAGKAVPLREKTPAHRRKKAYGGENVEEINRGCG